MKFLNRIAMDSAAADCNVRARNGSNGMEGIATKGSGPDCYRKGMAVKHWKAAERRTQESNGLERQQRKGIEGRAT